MKETMLMQRRKERMALAMSLSVQEDKLQYMMWGEPQKGAWPGHHTKGRKGRMCRLLSSRLWEPVGLSSGCFYFLTEIRMEETSTECEWRRRCWKSEEREKGKEQESKSTKKIVWLGLPGRIKSPF